MLFVLLNTGARIQEAYLSDVDFEREQVRLGTRNTASGGQYAWVPMTTELMEAIMGHQRVSRSLNVFVRQDGHQYVHRNKFMHGLCEKAGGRPFGFHAIRHLTATIHAHSGLDLPSVQAILRHRSPTTMARYIKSLGVQQNKIEAVFSNKKRGAKVVTFSASGRS
ncbi:MAG: tyrosine-type recombinase/integrase [Desulfovibrio sp.]|nr:tyrosine-type recombinase/integrase [Desulfovibrio sp.]